MSKQATAIVSWITPIGWLISYFAGDREGAKFYLNQSIVYYLCNIILSCAVRLLGKIPVLGALIGIVGWVLSIILFVCWILGLVYSCKQEEKQLPLIGGIQILK